MNQLRESLAANPPIYRRFVQAFWCLTVVLSEERCFGIDLLVEVAVHTEKWDVCYQINVPTAGVAFTAVKILAAMIASD
jgi:hypothetical protein